MLQASHNLVVKHYSYIQIFNYQYHRKYPWYDFSSQLEEYFIRLKINLNRHSSYIDLNNIKLKHARIYII